MQSVIRYYNADRGFGLIEDPDPNKPTIFFHIDDVQGEFPLKPGTAVEFEVGPNTNVKHPLRAANVKQGVQS
jgi:cold shock CspA family protein